MSVLTKLSAVRIQEAELLATECADPKCCHPLKEHRVSQRLNNPEDGCQHFDWEFRPNFKAKQHFCKCKGFRETADEQLPGIK